MSSPFSVFRKHQKIMLVVLVGLSMFAFVIFGTVSQASDIESMPPSLIALTIAALVGCVAWVVGLGNQKSSEYGMIGMIAGLVIGLVFVLQSGEPSVVTTNRGDLNRNEVIELMNEREIANQFIARAISRTFDMPDFPEQLLQFIRPEQLLEERIINNQFGFETRRDITERDVLLGELLRREAKTLGFDLPDQAVHDYLKMVTQNKLTGKVFREIRSEMRVSEQHIVESIRKELLARKTAEMMFGGVEFPPQVLWDFSRRLQVRQRVTTAAVPVASFVDTTVEPSTAELQELFAQYRNNFPGATAEGVRQEGLPGFRQPDRIRVAYLLADYENFEKEVEPTITEEDIKARYERDYVTPPATNNLFPDLDSILNQNGPFLPPTLPPQTSPEMTPPAEAPAETPPAQPAAPSDAAPAPMTPPAAPAADTPAAPADDKAPADEAPATPAVPPAGDAPAAPATPPAEPAAPAAEPPPAEAAPEAASETPADNGSAADDSSDCDDAGSSDDADSSDAPAASESPAADDAPAPATPTTPAADAPKADAPAPATEAPAADAPKADAPKVDAPPADAAADDAPKADAPKADAPKADDAAPEATPPAMPADAPATPGAGSLIDSLVPPKVEVPPLDEELKQTIREQLLQQRTAAAIQQALTKAMEDLREEKLGLLISRPEDDATRITLEQAQEKIKEIAAKYHFRFVETPLMSFDELMDSEEHRVGQAIRMRAGSNNPADSVLAAEELLTTSVRDILVFRQAERFGRPGETPEFYIYCKLEHRPSYIPEDLNDERTRDQVVKAWRQIKARDVARARAEELARKVRGSEQPLSDVLADDTVTGQEGSDPLLIRSTGQFPWMRQSSAPSLGLQQQNTPPELSQPLLPERVGEDFMHVVFDELGPNEVGVAPGEDHEVFYIVKIESRIPGTPEEWEIARTNFLAGGMQDESAQRMMVRELRGEVLPYWPQELFKKYDVQFVRPVFTNEEI